MSTLHQTLRGPRASQHETCGDRSGRSIRTSRRGQTAHPGLRRRASGKKIRRRQHPVEAGAKARAGKLTFAERDRTLDTVDGGGVRVGARLPSLADARAAEYNIRHCAEECCVGIQRRKRSCTVTGHCVFLELPSLRWAITAAPHQSLII